jgi:iron complex transport system ATP-binding protein
MNMACADKMKLNTSNAADTSEHPVVIRADNLSVALKENILLSNISFEVCAGELFSVVGANGAGKTSLLKALVGDLAYSGSVEFLALGHNPLVAVTGGSALGKNIAQHVAVLPQLSLLNFPFLASEVIALGRHPHSSGITADAEIIEAVAAQMDIGHLLTRSYTQLSGGEKQRVQLARVMAQLWPDASQIQRSSPKLLLLDEPMTALDPGHQQLVLNALSEFAKTGVAIIMVMHDINLAARYSDTMLALAAGQLAALGAPDAVVTPTVIQRLFGIDVEIMQHPVNHRPVMLTL